MEIIESTTLSIVHQRQIFILWNKEYPEKLVHQYFSDCKKYLLSLKDVSHILVVEGDRIYGWFAVFNRDKERWFAMIVDGAFQGKGIGTNLISRAKEFGLPLNGWVIDHNNDKKLDGSPYNSPLDFYLKNGFSILPDIRFETDKITAAKICWNKK